MAPRTWCNLWLSFMREPYGLPCNPTPSPPTHLNTSTDAQIAHTIIELLKSVHITILKKSHWQS